MPTTKKIEIIKKLVEKMTKAKGLIFTDFRGLSHLQIQELRKKLAETSAEYQVVKNTLLKIALEKSSYPPIETPGPTAILFAYQDELTSLRALATFAKETSLPTFKGGFLEKRFFEAPRLEELANVPGIDYLRGLLVNSLNSPISNLIEALKWNLSQLVFTLGEMPKRRPAQS